MTDALYPEGTLMDVPRLFRRECKKIRAVSRICFNCPDFIMFTSDLYE